MSHKQNCPIKLVEYGLWIFTPLPYCNCGDGVQNFEKQKIVQISVDEVGQLIALTDKGKIYVRDNETGSWSEINTGMSYS